MDESGNGTFKKEAKAGLRCDSLHRQQGDERRVEAELAAALVLMLKMNLKSLRTRAAE